MRQSQLFTKTRKEAPKDEVSKNAQLLIRAGYIHKEMAGVYAMLPLGLRVFNNIVKVIREEMNKIGGQELSMTTLQDPAPWKATGRWDDAQVDVWFKTELKSGGELGLGPTHEEPITALMAEYLSSYRDLPSAVYQFQNKFRNELRAKSGIMRTREFVMKDMYSFSRTEEEFRKFYEIAAEAYKKVFARVGLGSSTYRTFASGGSFSKFSDEFQTVSDAGEDIIYVHEGKKIAVNKEVYTDEILGELGLAKDELVEKKAIEVGNIFPLGTRFSDALNLKYTDESGAQKSPIMGCYGIGPARVMGTVAELLSDDKGLVWPEEIAPFKVHLVELSNGNSEVTNDAKEVYEQLTQSNVEVLWDDRDARAGEKFADSDLIGIPWRVVISEKTLASGKYECVERKSGKVEHLTLDELLKEVTHD
jgi:prolyl-tRNA synthetase